MGDRCFRFLAVVFPLMGGTLIGVEGCAGPAPLAAPPAEACAAPAKPGLMVAAYFGRNIDAHLGVSAKEWQRFVDRELTPRFAEGLTVTDVAGQYWDAANRRLIIEPSKLLNLVIQGGAESESEARSRLSAAIAAYKQQFRQQSVLTVETRGCYAFQ